MDTNIVRLVEPTHFVPCLLGSLPVACAGSAPKEDLSANRLDLEPNQFGLGYFDVAGTPSLVFHEEIAVLLTTSYEDAARLS
ncbi:MAG TPA: hypothetical protein VL361_04960 [Candidatus Limnocylindrales bacterium]|nr:hypothetical protein [Candidatus Limnocylindrales bacterium]